MVQKIQQNLAVVYSLKGEGYFTYFGVMQFQMHHQTKIVQWPPISLLLKSLGLEIYNTSPSSATRAVIQKL